MRPLLSFGEEMDATAACAMGDPVICAFFHCHLMFPARAAIQPISRSSDAEMPPRDAIVRQKHAKGERATST